MTSAQELKRLLRYDRKSGEFTWRVDVARNVKAGAVAGHLDAPGYIRIRINGRAYAAHRLAWLYVKGRWPVDQIDHINRIKTDNRFCNLRECTHTQNQQNRRAAKPYQTRQGKWHASIKHNGRTTNLGLFISSEAAQAAYDAAKAQLHFK